MEAQRSILRNCNIHREPKFGGVVFQCPLDDFHKLGFQYGDGLDIEFSNGEKLTNIPYYDNYYSPFDTPMVCGFPTFPEPRLAYNMTRDAWYVHHLDESCTADITLNTRGAFLDTQNNLSMNTSGNREDHDSDVAFANFRAVNRGSLKDNILFRGASPCDLEHNRNEYSDRFMKEAGVRFAISMADTQEEMDSYTIDDNVHSPYFKELNRNHLIYPINVGVNYRSEIYKSSLGQGLRQLMAHPGPYMVYCSLGKDRTGFFCTLLECLAGATYQEMEEEYMLTHKNFYHVDPVDTPEKYKAISNLYHKDMLMVICGITDENDLVTADFPAGATRYLHECGLSDHEISELKRILFK